MLSPFVGIKLTAQSNSRILRSNKDKWATVTSNNLDASPKCSVEWKKQTQNVHDIGLYVYKNQAKLIYRYRNQDSNDLGKEGE